MKSPYDTGRYNGGPTSTFSSGRISTGTTLSRREYTPTAIATYPQESNAKLNYLYFALVAIGFIIAALLFARSFTSPAAVTDQQAIAAIDGGLVNILRFNSGEIEALRDGSQATIRTNDMVSAEGGAATLRFFDDQLVRIFPNARLTVEKYENDESGRMLEYMVWGGQVSHESHRANDGSDWVQISTPSSNASIRNAMITVAVISPDETIYQVEEGIAWITMGADEVFLTPSEHLVAIAGQPLVTMSSEEFARSGGLLVSANGEDMQPQTDVSLNAVADIRSLPMGHQNDEEIVESTEWTYHIVQPGDSFWTIAAENSISLELLSSANPEIEDRSILPIGSSVRIPLSAN